MPNVGFQEIAGQLRERIHGGVDGWTAGQALPSETRLAAEFGVTRTTIRRALGALEAENLVNVVAGRGRFVRSASDMGHQPVARYEQVAATIREEISQLPAGARLDREIRLAERFDVAHGTIRHALGVLADEGIISSAQGRGWFVGLQDTASRTDKVVEGIERAIASGSITIGERLDGELALAAKYKVARVTVRRALAKLEADGLIESRSGKGRFVIERQRQG